MPQVGSKRSTTYGILLWIPRPVGVRLGLGQGQLGQVLVRLGQVRLSWVRLSQLKKAKHHRQVTFDVLIFFIFDVLINLKDTFDVLKFWPVDVVKLVVPTPSQVLNIRTTYPHDRNLSSLLFEFFLFLKRFCFAGFSNLLKNMLNAFYYFNETA